MNLWPIIGACIAAAVVGLRSGFHLTNGTTTVSTQTPAGPVVSTERHHSIFLWWAAFFLLFSPVTWQVVVPTLMHGLVWGVDHLWIVPVAGGLVGVAALATVLLRRSAQQQPVPQPSAPQQPQQQPVPAPQPATPQRPVQPPAQPAEDPTVAELDPADFWSAPAALGQGLGSGYRGPRS